MTWLIDAPPASIKEGFFGGVILRVFEILPYLHQRGIFPVWNIASKLYGRSPDFTVIPGLLDPSYVLVKPTRRIALSWLRERHSSVLGSDWQQLHRLWNAYFTIPSRFYARLSTLGDLSDALGVHYRGNDKLVATWDSNPVGHDEFLAIVLDFLGARSHLKRLFVATDDKAFLQNAQAKSPVPVVTLGGGAHHFEEKSDDARWQEAELAVTDCVALSRCAAVLNTSSALSAFAKVLNPEIEMFRCAASRMFSDIPYFPIAYVPVYASVDPEVQRTVDRMMMGDWTQRPDVERFTRPFFIQPRRIDLRGRVRNALTSPIGWWRLLRPVA
jgi:hypothetical protein